MQETFAKHTTFVGGMGSIINMQSPMPRIWRLLHRFFLLQRDYASGNFTLSGMPTHAYGNQHFMHIAVLGGCCMAFRKPVLNKHRFDEKLERYAYMEDADISWRVSQEGQLFYQPVARLYHHASPVARDAAVDNRAMFMRNYRYLFFKNVYPHHRLRIVAHWWTILGLSFKALLLRDTASVKGYLKAIGSTLR
jgi:GT2 family glycosyltransferase